MPSYTRLDIYVTRLVESVGTGTKFENHDEGDGIDSTHGYHGGNIPLDFTRRFKSLLEVAAS